MNGGKLPWRDWYHDGVLEFEKARYNRNGDWFGPIVDGENGKRMVRLPNHVPMYFDKGERAADHRTGASDPKVQWRNLYIGNALKHVEGLYNDVWSGPLTKYGERGTYLLSTSLGFKIVFKGTQAADHRT